MFPPNSNRAENERQGLDPSGPIPSHLKDSGLQESAKQETAPQESTNQSKVSDPPALAKSTTVNCPFCDELISAKAIKCKHCHSFLDSRDQPQSQPAAKSEPNEQNVQVRDRKIASVRRNSGSNVNDTLSICLGFSGAVILIVGVFLPVMRAGPVSIDYFQNGKGDGVIILGLGVISAALAICRQHLFQWLPAFASLGIMSYTIYNFVRLTLQVNADGDAGLVGSPFEGVEELVAESMSLEWGWLVLFGGNMLISMAAVLTPKPPSGIRSRR